MRFIVGSLRICQKAPARATSSSYNLLVSKSALTTMRLACYCLKPSSPGISSMASARLRGIQHQTESRIAQNATFARR